MSRLVGTQTVPGANSSSSGEWCPVDTSEEKEEAPTASALNDKVEQVVPEIKALIEACKTSGITQPSVDSIVKLCSMHGVAMKRRVMPWNCGIHPENRAHSGVDPVNVQNLCLAISKQGYSETKLEQPMGFEKQLEGPLHDVQEKLYEHNFVESNGYLKTIPGRDIECLPVTCSHRLYQPSRQSSAHPHVKDTGKPHECGKATAAVAAATQCSSHGMEGG